MDGLTVSQAARQLGCSYAWIRQLCDRGQLAYVRTPLGRLIDRDALARFAAERDQRRTIRTAAAR